LVIVIVGVVEAVGGVVDVVDLGVMTLVIEEDAVDEVEEVDFEVVDADVVDLEDVGAVIEKVGVEDAEVEVEEAEEELEAPIKRMMLLHGFQSPNWAVLLKKNA